MKQLKFLETKRTPRYSLRKFSVGMVSVLLGVTIFGINFTNHSVKAATTESVKTSNSSPNSNSQQTLAAVLTTAERTNTQKATSATEKVQQGSVSKNATANNSKEAATTPQSSPETQGSADTDINSSAAKLAATVDQNNTNTQKATSATEKVRQGSASKNATANNSKEAATTSQSAPKTQSSADTDIRSLTAISAAKLATMNLMQNGTDTDGNAAGTPGTGDRSAAATVTPDSINNQPAKENQSLANKTNLTSSDNYSSNIYKDKDGSYYKIVSIYGQKDYVYHAADIQANGGQTAADTKNNIDISKEDLGNGRTRWTVTFFPKKGLQNVGGSLHGLISAKFGIALTKDYHIVGNVDMEVINDPNQKYTYYKFEDGSNSATEITIQNPPAEKKFSFNPNTDVDSDTGLINSETLPAYNNKYLQGSYYFTTDTNAGIQNLWQTYFKDADERKNAYDGSPYLGGNHDFHFSTGQIANETGVDGAKQGDPIIYDTLGARKFNSEANSKGVFSSDNFNQAMEFKSQGKSTGSVFYSRSQYSSYVISFTTQHTDSHETELSTGSKNQQFSGISANIYSYQNGTTNMFSRLYGEQRALDAKGNPLIAGNIIPNLDAAKATNKEIDSTADAAKKAIDKTSGLTDDQKKTAKDQIDKAVDAAKEAIDKADSKDAVTKAVNNGTVAINKDAANAAIDGAAKTKADAIDNTKGLTDSEKQAAKSQVDNDAKAAKGAIDKADSKDTVTTAVNNGTVAINKDAANAAIDGALNNKKSEING
ncbi:LEA family epithelial adhesin, partial [Lactobacillus gallinarum]|uniref:LEA family epithelial adhesin n=1 Tax=Lactobacillus gallinarum TaxID=52242 RepID=UPI00243199AE